MRGYGPLFNYSGNPADSDLDRLRFRLQDTDSDDVLLEDEELNFLLDNEGSVSGALVKAARTIASQFSRQADDVSSGDVRIRLQNRADRYWKMAERFSDEADEDGLGKLGVSDVILQQDDDKLFKLKQHDNNERF